jgi:hypothetical protein
MCVSSHPPNSLECEPLSYINNYVVWDVTPCGSCKNRVSEELSASFITVTRNGELGTTLAVTSNRPTLRISSQRASVASYS